MQGQGSLNNITGPFIISGPGQGMYIYSGPPALGNLIESLGITAAGTDPIGLNAVLPGDTRYHNNGAGTWVAQQSTQSYIGYLWQTTNPAGPWTPMSTSIGFTNEFTSSPILQLHAASAGGRIDLADSTTADKDFTATGGSAANPSLITTDVWQTSFATFNSWTATGSTYPNQYRLMEDGFVHVMVDVNGGSTIANGSNIVQLTPPAAAAKYTPTALLSIDAVALGATVAPLATPHCQITTSRVIQCESLPTGTNRIIINTRFPAI